MKPVNDVLATDPGKAYKGRDGKVWIGPSKRWTMRHVNSQSEIHTDIMTQMLRNHAAVVVKNSHQLRDALKEAADQLRNSPLWVEGFDAKMWAGRTAHPLEADNEQIKDAVMDCMVASLCWKLRDLLNIKPEDLSNGKTEWSIKEVPIPLQDKPPRGVSLREDGYGRETKLRYYGNHQIVVNLPDALPFLVEVKEAVK